MEVADTSVETTTSQPPAPIEKKNLVQLVQEWPLSRKIATGAVVVISIVLFAVLIMQARIADQQLLYANLEMQDASEVVTWLKGQKIEYTLKNGGRDIWIPATQIYQSRLDLAANGMPSGGGVGFEIFDKQSFALTDYVQKVNYTRALQGELSRTISSLAPVETTRVHLALPEKRLFKNQQKSGTASVIVTLVPGKNLDQQQVQGIVHLVAGSVTNLSPDNVKVIDSSGVVLEVEKKKDDSQVFSGEMLAYQQEVEHRMEMRAQALLDKTMGTDNAMVRISATLDFSKVEKTEEFFDGEEPVIRSEQINQQSAASETEGGIPGVESNLQGNVFGETATGPSSSKTSRTTNYEISKTVSRIINPVGTITKLSVSVLVADKVQVDEEGKVSEITPRTPEELKSIENMVASAIGVVTERGDMINVLSMPFVAPKEVTIAAESEPTSSLYQFIPFIKYGLIGAGVFLLYFLLIRPVVKTMKGEVKEHYKTVEQLEKEQQQKLLQQTEAENELPMEPVDDTITQLRREVNHNQAPTAFIIKNWIQEG
ncbi:flagellar basal-body MS-ring/collar protein FliF [Desulforhopalus sp. 52FAK]